MVCVSFREAESERSNKTGHSPEDCMEQRAQNAKVKGSWHDHRHTMITDLAESGAGDQTKMDIAGHVSKNMFKHYSHWSNACSSRSSRTCGLHWVQSNGFF
jgi:integrase